MQDVTLLGPLALTTNYASVSLSPSAVTVDPGQSTTIIASFTPPAGVDPVTYPAYSGFIQVASGDETLRVSYLGVVGSLIDKKVLDTTSNYFGRPLPFVEDGNGDVQESSKEYTFVGADVPTVILR